MQNDTQDILEKQCLVASLFECLNKKTYNKRSHVHYNGIIERNYGQIIMILKIFYLKL